VDWRPKDPDVPETYAIDFEDQMILPPLRRFFFAEGAVIRAPMDTGFYYECTEPGRSGQRYPDVWPRQDGEEFSDGSAIFTCRHPASEAVPTIQSAVWSSSPAGILVNSQSETGRLAVVILSGGIDGQDYQVTCRMIPTIGNARDSTQTLRVRSL
jgi:hypothetical protein